MSSSSRRWGASARRRRQGMSCSAMPRRDMRSPSARAQGSSFPRSRCPIGRARPRRPKRVRRGRWRLRRSPSTTRARRRRAPRCARRPFAEPGSTSCWSGLPAVEASARAAAAERWLERSAGVADAAVRERDCRAGLRHPLRSALRGSVRPGSLGEAPLAATLPDGRVIAGHGRPAAGRGGPRLGDRLQDRQGARKRSGDSERPPCADAGLCRGAAGDLPRAAGQRDPCCTQPARNSSNSMP